MSDCKRRLLIPVRVFEALFWAEPFACIIKHLHGRGSHQADSRPAAHWTTARGLSRLHLHIQRPKGVILYHLRAFADFFWLSTSCSSVWAWGNPARNLNSRNSLSASTHHCPQKKIGCGDWTHQTNPIPAYRLEAAAIGRQRSNVNQPLQSTNFRIVPEQFMTGG